jgi:hypothetical protein
MFNKVEGGNNHEYYYADHYHRPVDPVVRRGWRLLLEETTVGVTSHIILTQIIYGTFKGFFSLEEE